MKLKFKLPLICLLLMFNILAGAVDNDYLTQFNESYLLFYKLGKSKMIKRDLVKVFEKKDNSSKVIKILNRGDIVIIKDKANKWIKIGIYPNFEGWIPCCEDLQAYKKSPVEILAKAALIYETDPEQAERLLNYIKKEYSNAEYYEYDKVLKKYILSEMADYYLALVNSCKRPRSYAKTRNDLIMNIKSGIEISEQSILYKYASCSFSMEETFHDYCYLAGKKYPPEKTLSILMGVSGKLEWKSQISLPYGIKVPIHFDENRAGFVVFLMTSGEDGWSWIGVCMNSGSKQN